MSQAAQRSRLDPATTVGEAAALHRQGRLAEAERLYRAVLALAPRQFDALHLLGVLSHQLGRSAEAADLIAAALAVNANAADAWSNHGLVLNALGRHGQALDCLDRALALDPGHVAAHANRGHALGRLGRHAEALASYDRALALKPDHAVALNDRGLALRRLFRPEEALASYDRALALAPDYPEALNNRAMALLELRRHDEALASFAAAQRARPDYAAAHYNEALARLLIGDFRGGWAKYEWRWQTTGAALPRLDVPVWDGAAPLAGKTLLLHAEQGFGDTIQFVRYIPLLARRGARIVLGVPPVLKRLLAGVEGVAAVVSEGDPLPPVDLHAALASLPGVFATDLESIPCAVPYLAAAETEVARWRDRLPAGRLRVGLVWSGSTTHNNDHNRSLALAQLEPLLALPDVAFVSLQRDLRETDATALAASPRLLHLGPGLGDFADTAAVLAALDVVVTVDTAVAHLAGALGKAVMILLPYLPDWRWMLDREDSPWYPSARLFRQPKVGDWDSVIPRVRDALMQFPSR